MVELIERLSQVFSIAPAAPAVGQNERWYSYGAIRELADRLSGLLAESGMMRGTPVGVLLRNRPQHFAVAVALVWREQCIVTVNPMLPIDPLVEDIEGLRLPVLVADAQDWENPRLVEAARRAGSIGISVAAEGGRFALSRVAGIEQLGEGKHRGADPTAAIEMLTSGTTGKPKRIKLAADSLSRSLWTGSKYEAGSDRPLALKKSAAIQWMPLVHIGGLFQALYSVYNGRRVVLMERFDLDEWHAQLLAHRPRFLNLPPSFLGRLLARDWPKEDFASLMVLRTGAAPLDHDLALEFEKRYGVPVLEAYGATEFAGGVAGWNIRDYRKYGATKRRSVGRANIGVELRVVDRETLEPLGDNLEGVLEVRSKQMDGGHSWIRTTDLARIDEDGFLYILGRVDNAIIRGGFKILPDVVEAALRAHPSLREACVVALPSEKLGQVPAAAIELRRGAPRPDDEALTQFLRERLKPYELPVEYLIVDEMPRTPSLKISQAEIRHRFAERARSAAASA